MLPSEFLQRHLPNIVALGLTFASGIVDICWHGERRLLETLYCRS